MCMFVGWIRPSCSVGGVLRNPRSLRLLFRGLVGVSVCLLDVSISLHVFLLRVTLFLFYPRGGSASVFFSLCDCRQGTKVECAAAARGLGGLADGPAADRMHFVYHHRLSFPNNFGVLHLISPPLAPYLWNPCAASACRLPLPRLPHMSPCLPGGISSSPCRRCLLRPGHGPQQTDTQMQQQWQQEQQ